MHSRQRPSVPALPTPAATGQFAPWVGAPTGVGAALGGEGFSALADQLPIVFWMTDASSGKLLYVSPAYEDLFGRPTSELYVDAKAYQLAIHPDDRDRVRRQLHNRGQGAVTEFRIVRPDGSIRWVSDYHYPIYAPGAPQRLGGVVTDITALKASEQELARMNEVLRESEGRLRELTEHLDAVFWLVEPDTDRLLYVSPRVADLFGITREEMSRDPEAYWRAVHPDDRERVRALLEKPNRDVEVEYRLRRADGSTIWVNDRSFPIRDEAGKVRRLAGLATDVTRRHEAEAEREMLIAAISGSSDGILVMLPDGTPIYANPALERITGYESTELVNAYRDGVGLDLSVQTLADLRAAIANGETWTGSFTASRADSTEFSVVATAWPLLDPAGGVRNVVIAFRDETQLTAMAAALADQLQQRAAIAESLSSIRPGHSAADTAHAVCVEMSRLSGVSVAGIIGFDIHGAAAVLAIQAPDGAPVTAGMTLPPGRAEFFRHQALTEPHAEDWSNEAGIDEIGRAWARFGITAGSWIPIRHDGEVLGILAALTDDPLGQELLAAQVPALVEFTAMTAALIGPQLLEERAAAVIRRRIRSIIDGQAFRIAFQPVCEIESGAVVGFEALSRFDARPPDEVFADAESVGVGIELEAATLSAAVQAMGALPRSAWVSLNVTPRLVVERTTLNRLLNDAPARLVLEVTEHTAVEDYVGLRDAVNDIGQGALLAVDDAGAGFASLRHIIELRPDFVKLDIGLIRGIDTDAVRQSMVAGMAHFATTTGCTLIAEGIETSGELEALRRLGVTLGQGYLLGRPLIGPLSEPARRSRREPASRSGGVRGDRGRRGSSVFAPSPN